jgi:hypothetical protein
MSHEVEAAAADSLTGAFRRPGQAPHGGACANCATPLIGAWCWKCGQAGEDFHRSVWRLIAEVFEGLFHLDGRVLRTLPALMWRPGALTRAYLDGHRAPQIPPLRLFLVVLLVVFLAGSIGRTHHGMMVTTITTSDNGKVITAGVKPLDQLSPAERAAARAPFTQSTRSLFGKGGDSRLDWFQGRMSHAMDDPERFRLILEQWAERFAFLTLPMAAAIMSLLFIFQRRFYVFDHTIFSLHSLSAAGLLLSAALLFSPITGGWSNLLLLAAPAHLFVHMRGVYRTGVGGTLARMLLLFILSCIGAMAIFSGLIWVGLLGMDG